jgi:hypothetical protein
MLSWLRKNPHLEAKGPRAERVKEKYPRFGRMACPSHPENRKFMRDSVAWLSETFSIGGINFETGDYGSCQCETCTKRAADRSSSYSLEDMVDQMPKLIATMLKARPQAIPLCEIYSFPIYDDPDAMSPLAALPKEAVLQWTIRNRDWWNEFLMKMDAEKVARLPKHTKVMRSHQGSQWGFRKDEERFKWVGRDFMKLAKLLSGTGFEGIHIFGEVGSHNTINEINYWSASYFADSPHKTWDDFMGEKLGGMLGGENLAREYVELIEKPEISESDLYRSKEILSQAADDTYYRWLWLTQRIHFQMKAGKTPARNKGRDEVVM